MQFKQLKWDENNETRPAGEWNWDALAATIRYECPACKEILRDSFAVRRSMALAGKWVPTNKKSPSDRVSYTWSALIVPWIPWIRIVQEFLMAKEAMDQGAHEPLKTFITETLGESWREQEMFGDDIMEPGGFRLGDPWPEESLRFMTVDVQKDHFWFVVRSWSKEGESRLVAEGKIQTVADIKDTAAAFKVPDRCVIMDCGYEQNRIFQVCCANGWVAFKGDERASFSTYHGGGIREVRPYSWPPLAGDPGLGTVQQGMQRCPFFMWSNPTVKDFLYRLKTGKGLGWGLPADVSAEYMRQMCSEAKRRTRNKKTGQVEHQWQVIGRRQNHLWDCECMQLVAAMIEGILVNPFATSKPVKDPDSQPVGDTVA
jgi:phage terminase large subunit GpA-like protein